MAIVRTLTKAMGGVTPAEAQALKAHAAKWIANAMSTAPVAPERLVPAIKALYAAADLKEPRVVIVSSPLVMAFAGGFAAAIWWARKNHARALKGHLLLQATDAATRAATYAATSAAIDAAIDAATRAATYAATYAAIDAATRAATSAATGVATDAATSAATGERFAALALELGREFGVAPNLMLRCASNWLSMYQGGNMWSAWDSYITAFRDVIGLVLTEHDKYRAWEACAIEGGFRVLHEEFCIVSDRPEILTMDDSNRPHNATGPSHRWRDGWTLYHWHGLRVPDDLIFAIESPGLITVGDIERQTNAELRRMLIDRYGAARYVADSGAIVVHELPADHPIPGLRTARVLRKDVPGDEAIVYVDLLNSTPEPNGTVKRYMLRVDPNAYGGEASRNAHAAAASTWRDSTSGAMTYRRWQDYAPAAES